MRPRASIRPKKLRSDVSGFSCGRTERCCSSTTRTAEQVVIDAWLWFPWARVTHMRKSIKNGRTMLLKKKDMGDQGRAITNPPVSFKDGPGLYRERFGDIVEYSLRHGRPWAFITGVVNIHDRPAMRRARKGQPAARCSVEDREYRIWYRFVLPE